MKPTACLALIFFYISLVVRAQSNGPTLLWQTEVYTNYPRNYGPGIVHTVNGSDTLFFQGTANCATFLTVVAMSPVSGVTLWAEKELPNPAFCGFEEQLPISDAAKLFFFVNDPEEEGSPPTLMAYHVEDGRAAWTAALGSDDSTAELSNIVTHQTLVITAVHETVYALNAFTGATVWTRRSTSGMYCNSLQVVNQDDYSIVVCSSGHRVLAMNTSTGEGLWEVQAGGNFSRFDTVGKVTFDKYTQFLFFQFAPLQFVNQGFIMAVDAWTGALAWNVSQGMNTTGGAASVNLVGLSEGVVVTVEGADWGTDWMVGRDSTNGALLWNVTSSMGGFGPFWIDTGVIYVIVNETWVEARSVEDGGVQWKWHTDWCKKHHDIGVSCGLAAPYVWDGKLYLNFGFGAHDTCPFLALQIPSPTANRKAGQMTQVAFD